MTIQPFTANLATAQPTAAAQAAMRHTINSHIKNTQPSDRGSVGRILAPISPACTYTYDQVGNRLTSTDAYGTRTYTINNDNQYTAITGLGTLTYNSRGDLASLHDWEFLYDTLGNLISASNSQSNSNIAFHFDPSGARTIKEIDGNKTVYFNIGTNQLEKYDVSTDTFTSTIYEPGIDQPHCEIVTSNNAISHEVAYFYHQDFLGSVVALTDEDGEVVESYSYDAWGTPTAYDPQGQVLETFISRFLYTGREYDSETKFYHYRARAYSPELGRFLQMDPIDFSGTDTNLYRYCQNNPINFNDPTGLLIRSPNDVERRKIQDSINRISKKNSKFAKDLQKLLDKDKIKIDTCLKDKGAEGKVGKWGNDNIYLSDMLFQDGIGGWYFDNIFIEESIHHSQFHEGLASKMGYIIGDITTAIISGLIRTDPYESMPSEVVAKGITTSITGNPTK